VPVFGTIRAVGRAPSRKSGRLTRCHPERPVLRDGVASIAGDVSPFLLVGAAWESVRVSDQGTATDPTSSGDRRLDTIRALLAKAEATDFPEEAEAFFAKASELISRWAIDEALLWAGADASGREQPDELQLVVHTP